ncbi:chitin synthase-domain-containing protein [Biscogniauxia mediterranea]|nr:chitin synthase-domain-containing protein [Biscogniauxia mediterranea]
MSSQNGAQGGNNIGQRLSLNQVSVVEENPFNDNVIQEHEDTSSLESLPRLPQRWPSISSTYSQEQSERHEREASHLGASQPTSTHKAVANDHTPPAELSTSARSGQGHTRPPPPPPPPRRKSGRGRQAPGESSTNDEEISPAPPITSVVQTPPAADEKSAAQTTGVADPKLIQRGKRKVKIHKYLLNTFLVSVNVMLIFSTWFWPKFYYIYLPFISLPLALNCVMIFNIIVWQLKNLIWKPKKVVPPQPETMVLLMPCYNETREECTKSLDSLVNQTHIDEHQKAILVVCDGKVRGPGMEKTTAQYLIEDIFVGSVERRIIRAAYVAWDGQSMDVEISRGTYKGIPFFCIVKQQNQGKRDSLIVSRSFVHNFNKRAERPKVIFTPEFFTTVSDWLIRDAGIERIDILIGMDADTVFSPDCISKLVEESHYPNTVGVCGYVSVDFSSGNWNLWSVYQSAEYTIAQALRRLHQSVVTHKVSCLPGCCQLLRVCEETCGDRVLVQRFGYHPTLTDGLIKRIRATASEDRNHVCLMLMDSPHVQTRQALRAYAYTDVPRSLSVFLSQRRRWTLGATGNDLMLLLHAPLFRFNIWERIVALSNVLTWCLNAFVIASLASMIYAFMHQPLWIILVFASVMIVPLCYYISISIWMPRSWLERFQYLLGLVIFTVCGPFINIGVTFYACFHMDSFGWGKTRQVISEEPEAAEQNEKADAPAAAVAAATTASIPGVSDLENQVEGLRTPFTVPSSLPGDVGVRQRS